MVAKPTIAPTMECVVETGQPARDAMVNQTAAAMGTRVGMTAIEFVAAILACHKERKNTGGGEGA